VAKDNSGEDDENCNDYLDILFKTDGTFVLKSMVLNIMVINILLWSKKFAIADVLFMSNPPPLPRPRLSIFVHIQIYIFKKDILIPFQICN